MMYIPAFGIYMVYTWYIHVIYHVSESTGTAWPGVTGARSLN